MVAEGGRCCLAVVMGLWVGWYRCTIPGTEIVIEGQRKARLKGHMALGVIAEISVTGTRRDPKSR